MRTRLADLADELGITDRTLRRHGRCTGGKTFRPRWLCRLGIDDDLSARRALNERTYPEFHKVVERDHAV